MRIMHGILSTIPSCLQVLINLTFLLLAKILRMFLKIHVLQSICVHLNRGKGRKATEKSETLVQQWSKREF